MAIPAVTNIFVRNDSRKTWEHVKLTLNGVYTYERLELAPGQHVQLPIDRFAVYDSNGRMMGLHNMANNTLIVYQYQRQALTLKLQPGSPIPTGDQLAQEYQNLSKADQQAIIDKANKN